MELFLWRSSRRSFFFSSRRRHTSSLRDWSSDVCSSDLLIGAGLIFFVGLIVARIVRRLVETVLTAANIDGMMARAGLGDHPPTVRQDPNRSEERRVGKECRARWWPYQYTKNSTQQGHEG